MRSLAVAGDLDDFGRVVEEKGWPSYSPNPATGMLTEELERFLSLHPTALVIKGPDRERGTEEFLVEIPAGEHLLEDVEAYWRDVVRRFRERFEGEVTLSVGIAVGPAPGTRRDAVEGGPASELALKALRMAKREGGDTVVVLR
ncbi:MAG: hypothetical protein GXO28_06180 [Methanopyri archaeon]|nr:hypothetical protein [Methanopyri archaeon]